MNNLTTEDQKFLELYSDSIYDKPSVTVDAVILRLYDAPNKNYRKLPEKKLQVFLTKRQNAPYKDRYSIIGTFIDLNHELSETLKLCVNKKVGLSNFYYEQLFTFGDKARDPRTRVISTSYLLLANKDHELTNGEWFDVNLTYNKINTVKQSDGFVQKQTVLITLSNKEENIVNTLEITHNKSNMQTDKTVRALQSDLAFDHAKIILYAIERLKNKLEYTDIAFNLLQDKFTLTELKNSYETILGQKLLDANFRRKINKMVEATNEFSVGYGHRTSQLFKLNPHWTILNLD